MKIEAIRFRTEGALMVLQVLERSEDRIYGGSLGATWRDAKVEDMLDVARVMWRHQESLCPASGLKGL